MTISFVNGHIFLLSAGVLMLMIGGGIYMLVSAIKIWREFKKEEK